MAIDRSGEEHADAAEHVYRKRRRVLPMYMAHMSPENRPAMSQLVIALQIVQTVPSQCARCRVCLFRQMLRRVEITLTRHGFAR